MPASTLPDAVRSLTPLTAARAYLKLGLPPLPACPPEHDCKAPGKAVHVKKWTRFATEPPAEAALPRMFGLHANVTIAIPPGVIVLDVDARHDGLKSLDLMTATIGPLPDTPMAQTGGGGRHVYLRLPTGQEVGTASGAFDLLGFPGVEWRTLGGAIVAPPSRHTSGKRYQWLIDQSPADIPIAEAPSWLLDLIKQVKVKRYAATLLPGALPQAAPDGAPPAPSKAKYTWDQMVAIFAAPYHAGERRGSLGLPRLVGLLRSKGTNYDDCLAFLQDWQASHFFPPLPPDVLEYQVRDMYKRWGEPAQDAWDRGRACLKNLRKAMAPRPAHVRSHPVPPRPLPGANPQPEVPRDDVRRALAEQRMAEIYNFRRAYITIGSPEPPRLKSDASDRLRGQPTDQQLAYSLPPQEPSGIRGGQLSILLEDPALAVSKSDLVYYVGWATGHNSRLAARVEHCGWAMDLACYEHGARSRTRSTCKLPAHTACPSDTTIKVRQLVLPDLGEGSCYLETWLAVPVALEGDDPEVWQRGIEKVMGTWEAAVTRVNQRKATRGRVLFRGMAFYLDYPTATAHCKVMMLETSPGELDAPVQGLAEALGGRLYGQRRLRNGETAVVQLIEDTMGSLIGVNAALGDQRYHLFTAYWNATRRRKVFQPLSVLYGAVKTVKIDEKPRCDVCGRVLSFVLVSPEDEQKEGQARQGAARQAVAAGEGVGF